MHRHRIGIAMGKNGTLHYTSLITIFIESAALIMMVGIIFTITFIFNFKAQYLFSRSLIHIQAIASFLIILRVCQGKAWSKRMVEKPRGNDTVHPRR
ncbi:hypothetical protein BDQ12DRAFT_691793 [Crucibulum laeve]|uniref:Uncharacterized protein n=1 Tax=Crucibulum laeve TaxID=68775 RepID=A0A5C3LKC4_9AGAR|nr:hypothetical protein BDQ12DRAFT_691793 [Crucibulum laeve]